MRVLLLAVNDTVPAPAYNALIHHGSVCDMAYSVADGLTHLKYAAYDLIVTFVDAAEAARIISRLRESRAVQPILAAVPSLSSRDKAALLDVGADDVLTGSWQQDEFLARARALLRRTRGHASSDIVIGALRLRMDSRDVQVGGQMLHLSPKEYAILELLVLHRNIALNKEDFMNYLYASEKEPEVKIIDVLICRLRRKLSDAGLPALISTLWGRGYILREPEAAGSMAPLARPVIPAPGSYAIPALG